MAEFTPETPAWEFAQFAVREFWIELSGQIEDGTMAAAALAHVGSNLVAEMLDYEPGNSGPVPPMPGDGNPLSSDTPT